MNGNFGDPFISVRDPAAGAHTSPFKCRLMAERERNVTRDEIAARARRLTSRWGYKSDPSNVRLSFLLYKRVCTVGYIGTIGFPKKLSPLFSFLFFSFFLLLLLGCL